MWGTALAVPQVLDAAGEFSPVRVKPLLASQWGEDGPFNMLLPTIDDRGTHAAAGSTATALAQILNYHKWPKGMEGVLPGYVSTTLERTIPELVVDEFPSWAALQNYYMTDVTVDTLSDLNRPVAQLMQYCAQVVRTDYGTQSSAATQAIVEALTQYFNYAPTVRLVRRSYYTNREWLELINSELRASRPVIYRAQAWHGSGHSFVIDGIDGEGRVHINWGWHGNADGYYYLSQLNPQADDSNVDATTNGWTLGDAMIVGIEPNRGTTTYAPTGLLSFYNLTVPTATYSRDEATGTFAGVTVGGRFNNDSSCVGAYDLGFVLYDQLGNPVREVMKATVAQFYPGHGTNREWNLDMGNLAAGEYTLLAVSRAGGSDTWQLCTGAGANAGRVTVTSSTLSIIPCGNSGTASLSVSDVSLDDLLQATRSCTLTATVTNTGTRHFTPVYVLLDGRAVGAVTCDIAPGFTGNVVARFTPDDSGRHRLQLALDEQGSDIVYSTNIMVDDPAVNGLSMRMSRMSNSLFGNVVNSGTMQFTATITNRSNDAAYCDDIVARLYRNNGTSEGVFAGIATTRVDIPAAGSGRVTFAFEHLPANEKYSVAVSYYSKGRLTGTISTPYYTVLGDYPRGDVNHDRVVDVTDVNLTINMMMGKAASAADADVNEDGVIDVTDVNLIINLMMGKH